MKSAALPRPLPLSPFARAAAGLAAAALAGPATAQAAEPAAEGWSAAWSVLVVSDYKPRGISQSHNRPSLQAGVDLTHGDGWYAGLWAFTIDILRQSCRAAGAPCGRSYELDLLGGWRGELADGWPLDLGAIRYQYPGNRLGEAPGFVNPNTTEAYAGLGRGPWQLKASHSLTPYGGFPGSRGSSYLELNLTQEIGDGLTLLAHVGRQHLRRNGAYDATDVRLGLARTLAPGLTGSLTLNGSDADRRLWTVGGRDWGRPTVVLGLQLTR